MRICTVVFKWEQERERRHLETTEYTKTYDHRKKKNLTRNKGTFETGACFYLFKSSKRQTVSSLFLFSIFFFFFFFFSFFIFSCIQALRKKGVEKK